MDVGIIEVGGTVGDIESLPFLEAIRQMRIDIGQENTLYLHLTLVPNIKTSGELKTKPTQHSVKLLREIGIQPDILLCRCDRYLPMDIRRKIALFCNVPTEKVISAPDVKIFTSCPSFFMINSWINKSSTVYRCGLEQHVFKSGKICYNVGKMPMRRSIIELLGNMYT